MSFFKIINLKNIFIFAFIYLYVMRMFFIPATFFSRIVFFTLILITGYSAIKVWLFDKKKIFFIWMLYLFMFFHIIELLFSYTYELAYYDEHIANPFEALKALWIILMSFFGMYYFAQRGELKRRTVIYIFFFLLLFSIFNFYFYEQTIRTKTGRLDDELINNSGYLFVALLLFILLFKQKKLLAYLISFILLFYIVLSAKRGAIIAGMLLFLANTFYLEIQLKGNVKKIIANFVSLSLVLLVLGIMLYLLFENNPYLQVRFEQALAGNSSGRDRIYASIWDAWYNSDSIWNYIFGLGYLSSLNIAGNYAHNDWLELLSSFGLLGVFAYVLFFIGLINIILCKGNSLEQKYCATAFVIYLGFRSIFSMGYTDYYTTLGLILMGFILGEKRHLDAEIMPEEKNLFIDRFKHPSKSEKC